MEDGGMVKSADRSPKRLAEAIEWLFGLGILMGFYFIGAWLTTWVPIPANVIGLIIFTICLFFGVVRVEWVERAAMVTVRHMLLFFAPVIVGVLVLQEELKGQWLSVFVGIAGSFAVVLLVTGWTADALVAAKSQESN